MLPDKLAASDEVPDPFVAVVIDKWGEYVQEQMCRAWPELVDAQPWLFTESMQYLMTVLLVEMGALKPSAISFSFMNSIVYDSDCEVFIAWQPQPSKGHIDPFELETDCSVMRLVDMPWPAMVEFLTDADARSDLIKRWTWLMSAAVEAMPKED